MKKRTKKRAKKLSSDVPWNSSDWNKSDWQRNSWMPKDQKGKK